MPYKTINEAEEKNPGLKKYSDKAKRGWMGSFNGCMKDGGPEDKCYAIAYSVANKVDGRKPSTKKSSIDEKWVARELIAAAKEVDAGLMDDIKVVKMRAVVEDFLDEVKFFKGDINKFLKQITSMVDNPKALMGFPEMRGIVELSTFLKKGVLKYTFMSPKDISERMQKVVELDA